MEGLDRNLYELFIEYVIPIAILLLVGVAILKISNPEHTTAVAIASEIASITSMASDTTMQIKLDMGKINLRNLHVSSSKNQVQVSVKKNTTLSKQTYFGPNTKIVQKGNIITINS